GFELCYSENILHPYRCTKFFLSYAFGQGGWVGGFRIFRSSIFFNYYYSGVGGTHPPTHPLLCGWVGFLSWKIRGFSEFLLVHPLPCGWVGGTHMWVGGTHMWVGGWVFTLWSSTVRLSVSVLLFRTI